MTQGRAVVTRIQWVWGQDPWVSFIRHTLYMYVYVYVYTLPRVGFIHHTLYTATVGFIHPPANSHHPAAKSGKGQNPDIPSKNNGFLLMLLWGKILRKMHAPIFS